MSHSFWEQQKKKKKNRKFLPFAVQYFARIKYLHFVFFKCLVYHCHLVSEAGVTCLILFGERERKKSVKILPFTVQHCKNEITFFFFFLSSSLSFITVIWSVKPVSLGSFFLGKKRRNKKEKKKDLHGAIRYSSEVEINHFLLEVYGIRLNMA